MLLHFGYMLMFNVLMLLLLRFVLFAVDVQEGGCWVVPWLVRFCVPRFELLLCYCCAVAFGIVAVDACCV